MGTHTVAFARDTASKIAGASVVPVECPADIVATVEARLSKRKRCRTSAYAAPKLTSRLSSHSSSLQCAAPEHTGRRSLRKCTWIEVGSDGSMKAVRDQVKALSTAIYTLLARA